MQIVHTILKVWREKLDILFAEHINTLYSACQVYIKAESSEKNWKPQRHKISTFSTVC